MTTFTTLVDYSKMKATDDGLSSCCTTMHSSTSLSSKKSASSSTDIAHNAKVDATHDEVLSTVEYLLSLPMEDPMNDSFDLRSAHSATSMASFADEDLDDEDEFADDDDEEDDSKSHKSSKSNKSSNSKRKEKKEDKDRRDVYAKSVSFTLRRSRSLNRSKTFDERLSSSAHDRLHLSLVGIGDGEDKKDSATSATTGTPAAAATALPKPKSLFLGTSNHGDHKSMKNIRLSNQGLATAAAAANSLSMSGSLSLHESSKSIFGGNQPKRSSSGHGSKRGLLGLSVSLHNTSESIPNNKKNYNAKESKPPASATKKATKQEEQMADFSDRSRTTSRTSRATRIKGQRSLSPKNDQRSFSPKRSGKGALSNAAPMTCANDAIRMAYFSGGGGGRKTMPSSRGDFLGMDNSMMADESDISIQVDSLMNSSSRQRMDGSSRRHSIACSSATSMVNDRDASFLEQSARLFTGSKITRHQGKGGGSKKSLL